MHNTTLYLVIACVIKLHGDAVATLFSLILFLYTKTTSYKKLETNYAAATCRLKSSLSCLSKILLPELSLPSTHK